MSSGHRRVRINRLRDTGNGERGVLTNARCLNEGVDVPTLDGVAFIDPRRSQTDIVQAVGRAIRKSEDKNTTVLNRSGERTLAQSSGCGLDGPQAAVGERA